MTSSAEVPPRTKASALSIGGRPRASILRRMRFASRSRYALDRLAGSISRSFRLTFQQSYHLVVDRIIQISFDLIERLRCGSFVQHIGNVRATVPLLGIVSDTPQFPGEEGFIYNANRHILIGTQVGVDLVFSGGKYFIVDINADAAMRPERRQIFAAKFDPVVTAIVDTAQTLKFKRLVVVRWHWEGIYEPEWIEAGRARGIEVIPACYSWFDTKNAHAFSRFPRLFESETMYVSFGPRYSPFEFFLNDKIFGYQWIHDVLTTHPELASELAVPHTSDFLHVPHRAPEDAKPNLVIKATGKQSGKAVAMARVRTDEEAMLAFGMKRRDAFPLIFRDGLVNSFLDRMFGRDQLLFQEYVPPSVDARGHAQIYRLHILVSPLTHRLLAAHKVIAPSRLPEHQEFGLVSSPDAYVVNYSRGGTYSALDEGELEQLARVGDSLGQLIQAGARQYFAADWVKAG